VTSFRLAFVDVYPVRAGSGGLQVLALRRSSLGRCPGSWEVVHGRVEDGEGPVDAALRELREETGLVPERLYNLSRVEAFYRHSADEVAFIPVFVGFMPAGEVSLGPEHDTWAWLPLAEAGERLAWPRERRGLEEIATLLTGGHAGALEDVLRVR
jgi:dATP pyrophosphohydrolase